MRRVEKFSRVRNAKQTIGVLDDTCHGSSGVGWSGVEIGSLGPLQLQENMKEDHGGITHQRTIC